MQAGSVIRIEKNVERGASVAFALSCSYAGFGWVALHGTTFLAGFAALCLFSPAYMLCARLLGKIEPEARPLHVPIFHVEDIERDDPRQRLLADFQRIAELERAERSPLLLTSRRGKKSVDLDEVIEPTVTLDDQASPESFGELLLTDIVDQASEDKDDALLLDQPLKADPPESRVVQLFGAVSPTPGQLKSRIDRHLERNVVDSENFDASQALHEALAELRRSLR